MKVEHAGLDQLVRFSELVDLLYSAVAAQTPLEALAPQSDSVTLSAAGAGIVVFKRSQTDAHWQVTGMGAKSAGGHTFTVETYSDPSWANPSNLLDFSSGSSEYTSDRSSPIIVPSGHFLVVKISAGTSGDQVTVTMQGQRVPTLGRG